MFALTAQAKPPKSDRQGKTAESQAVQVSSTPSAATQKTEFPAKQDATHSSLEKPDVYGTLLLALSAMEGVLFAMLGVVVQVGSTRSLRMGSAVFPIVRYICVGLTLFWLQALFLLPLDTRFFTPTWAYIVFTANVIAIGVIAVQAIRALDPNNVVDRTLDWYFDE
jgi:hypothetical protein